MRKNILKILTLVVFLIGCLTSPINTQAASTTKISNDYTMGNSKYYFANSVSNESIIYFCKADKNGRNETILCKVNAREIKNPDYMAIDGYYKNKFYYTVGHYYLDSFLGYIDLKKKQIEMTEYPGVIHSISNSQYILSIEDRLEGGALPPVYVFDAKKNKITLLAKYCDLLTFRGNNVYFIQSSSGEFDNVRSATLNTFNLKNNKRKTIKTIKNLYMIDAFEANFLVYTDSKNEKAQKKILQFGNQITTLKDGIYVISAKVYAKSKGNYLDLYACVDEKQTKNTFDSEYKHYKLKTSKDCKYYKVDRRIKGDWECTKAAFNELNKKIFSYGKSVKGKMTITNGLVTSISI